MAVGAAVFWGLELLYIYHHFLQLVLAAFAFTVGLSAYLAVRAAGAPPAALAPGSSGEQRTPRGRKGDWHGVNSERRIHLKGENIFGIFLLCS